MDGLPLPNGRWWRLAAWLSSALLAAVLAAAPRPAAAIEPGLVDGTEPVAAELVGLPLAEALERLEKAGVPVIFSNATVRPDMVVAQAPRGDTPRALLDGLLAPHGLAVREGPGGHLVVISAPQGDDDPPPESLPVTEDVIDVATSELGPLDGAPPTPVASVAWEPEEPARRSPVLADDALRSAGLLPGATAAENSSRIAVRGNRWQDVMVVLDGVELVAPYHLHEYDAALSIVPGDSLARVELIADPYPAEYGDRMGGVLDLTSRTPRRPLVADLGLGTLSAEAVVGGTLDDQRGSWLASSRAGNYRLALEADGRHENPRYWDLFGRFDHLWGERQSVRARLLVAQDELHVAGAPVGGGRYDSQWENGYLWLTHAAVVGPRLTAESVVWGARLERSRLGRQAELGVTRFDLADRRDLDLGGAKTVWRRSSDSGRWRLTGGAEARRTRSTIDYRATGTAGSDDGELLVPGTPDTTFRDAFEFDQVAAFWSLRAQPWEGWSVEGGLRYDETHLTREELLSPRLHLAWRPGEGAGVVRAGWGQFRQSQRPYELQVEDGETEISPTETAEQALLAYEWRLAGGSSWRASLFRRTLRDPRPRWEALFDTAVLYPELAPGRVRVAPDRSRAAGLEIAVSGAPRPRFGWSAVYTLSSVEDRIDGCWAPRDTDEPHALRVDAHRRLPRGWWLQGVWQYHTGWPTTAVTTGTDGGAQLGPIRGERLPDYHRLDLRLGRAWALPHGRLSAWVDVQNAYDRDNVRGFEGFDVGADGRVTAETVGWGGFLPSFGLRWSY